MLYNDNNSIVRDNLKETSDLDYLIPKTSYILKFNNLFWGWLIIIYLWYKNKSLFKKNYNISIFEKTSNGLKMININTKHYKNIENNTGKIYYWFNKFSELKSFLKSYLKNRLTDYKNELPF